MLFLKYMENYDNEQAGEEGQKLFPPRFGRKMAAIMATFVAGIIGGLHHQNGKISGLELALRKEKQAHIKDCADWKKGYDENQEAWKKEFWEMRRDTLKEGRKERLALYAASKAGLKHRVEDPRFFAPREGDGQLIKDGLRYGFLEFKAHKIEWADTLNKIAEQYNVPRDELVSMNNSVSGMDGATTIDNVDKIPAGNYLMIPQVNLKVVGEYTVQKGDTLHEIARNIAKDNNYDERMCARKGTFFQRMVLLNRLKGRLKDKDKIEVGTKLLIPDYEDKN